MEAALSLLAICAIVFVPMTIEVARAARHERAQRARGGVEPRGDVYRAMRVAYPGAFLAMIVEGGVRGLPPAGVWWAGVALFAAAKALKWWAIAALGPSWTFRVIVVPGVPLVTGGPYRYLRHPNYVGVVGELVSAATMTGARLSGPIAVAAFGLLIARRVSVERCALAALPDPRSGEGAILRRE